MVSLKLSGFFLQSEGHINLDSTPGEGTRVDLSLKRERTEGFSTGDLRRMADVRVRFLEEALARRLSIPCRQNSPAPAPIH